MLIHVFRERIKFDHIIAVLTGALLIIMPLLNTMFPYSVFHDSNTIFFSVYYLSAILLLILLWKIFSKKSLKKNTTGFNLSYLDIAVFAYLLYGFLNLIFVREFRVDALWICKWIGVVLLYMVCRSISSKSILINAVILSGLVQTLICFLQLAGFFSSNNDYFTVTGSFDNPGPLAGYLAVALIMCLVEIKATIQLKKKNETVLYIVFGAILFVALLVTDSRAGFLGVFAGAIYQIATCRKGHFKAFILAIITSIILGIIMFAYRSSSAMGRLLVWRVSSDMILDCPWMGQGVGSFNEKYMFSQADYFSRHLQSSFAMLADTPISPFNELIHIGVEEGFLGIFLFLLLLSIALIPVNTDLKDDKIFKSALFCLFIFSLFSYTASVYPLLMLFPVIMGSLKSSLILIWKREMAMLMISIMIICSIMIFVGNSHSKYITVNKHLVHDFHNHRINNTFCNADEFDYFKFNIDFQDVYSQILCYSDDYNVTMQMKEIAYSFNSYCLLGKMQMKYGFYTEAKYYFEKASQMIPNRIEPNYLLWELSTICQDIFSAINYAEIIINQPIKVENTYTLTAKARMGLFLSEFKHMENEGASQSN